MAADDSYTAADERACAARRAGLQAKKDEQPANTARSYAAKQREWKARPPAGPPLSVGDHKCEATKSVARCGRRRNILLHIQYELSNKNLLISTNIPSGFYTDETSDRTATAAEDPAQWDRKALEANRQSVIRYAHARPV
jgi:hypothetical protein